MATFYSNIPAKPKNYKLTLVISDVTPLSADDIANNRSRINWAYYITSGDTRFEARSTYSLTINGTSLVNVVSEYFYTYAFNTQYTIASGTMTIPHNSDGTKTISFSASFKTDNQSNTWSVPLLSISSTMALQTVPRYATFTGFAADINDLNASISWSSDKTISTYRYSKDGGSSYTAWTTINANSASVGSISVTPGGSYNFIVQITNSESGLVTTSNTITKTATKTPSTLTLGATRFNVDSSGVAYTISESYSDYRHQITYAFGNANDYILGSSGVTSTTLSGSWTNFSGLATQIPNATSGVGTIYLYTYSSGGTYIGVNSYAFTIDIPNTTAWKPTASITSISENTTNMSAFAGVYVQSKSTLKCICSGGGKGGSSPVSYTWSVGGVGTYSGTTITSGILKNAGTIAVTVTVTDSRGYTQSATQNVTVTAYSPPNIIAFTGDRNPVKTGKTLSGVFNFNIASVANKNVKKYRLRFRPVGGTWVYIHGTSTTFVTTTYSTGGNVAYSSATDALSATSSYEVEFYIGDYFTEVIRTVTVSTANVIWHAHSSGSGLAVGKYSEIPDTFEVDLPSIFNNSLVALNGVAFKDTRAASDSPQDLPSRAISFDFKLRSSVGNPPTYASGMYAHIITVAGWNTTEGSGGWPTQLSIGNNGISYRTATSATTWGAWQTLGPGSGTTSWSAITDKPTTFEPSAHNQAWSTITSVPTQATRWPTWTEVTSKPTTFTPATHSHAWADITSKPTTFTPATHTHGFTKTTLLASTAYVSNRTYNLTQAYTNFDLVILYVSVYYVSASDNNFETQVISPGSWANGGVFSGGYNFGTNRQYGFFFPNNTQIQCTTALGNVTPRIMIEGIKYTS